MGAGTKTKPSQSSLAEMSSVLVNISNLSNLLVKDVYQALNDLKEENDELKPYRRRIFIRTFFALVEGLCFCHRNVMLNCTALSDHTFSVQEILKLKELREVTWLKNSLSLRHLVPDNSFKEFAPNPLDALPEWRVPSRQGHRKLARHTGPGLSPNI